MTVPRCLTMELPHQSEEAFPACRVKIALHGEKLAVSRDHAGKDDQVESKPSFYS
ncbi:MAG: hypothetical protein JXM72_02775 [Deltaproteobacteria bacterium]|nr:hypothetical protein [Deltaproteobacteria bacterium]